MDTIIFLAIVTIIIVLLCVLFAALAPAFIIGGIILWIIGWISNKNRAKNRPQDIPDNPYQEIYGNNRTNPFEGERFTTSQQNLDVIDVEYTEHEETNDD